MEPCEPDRSAPADHDQIVHCVECKQALYFPDERLSDMLDQSIINNTELDWIN